MSAAMRRRQIDALRGWLQGELGDDAHVYHQNSADPLPAASGAERFSITVPVADSVSLLWLWNKSGPVRTVSMVLIVIGIVPDGEVRSAGRVVKRDFVVHFREVA